MRPPDRAASTARSQGRVARPLVEQDIEQAGQAHERPPGVARRSTAAPNRGAAGVLPAYVGRSDGLGSRSARLAREDRPIVEACSRAGDGQRQRAGGAARRRAPARATCWASRWCARRARSCSTWSSRCAAQPAADSGPATATLAALLEDVDVETAARLVRAFGTYFHLANVTEQVHRARAMRDERVGKGGWLAQTAERIRAAGLAAARGRRHSSTGSPYDPCSPHTPRRRPGGRSCPSDGGWPSCSRPRTTPRADRRIAEVIDLLWQTAELRLDRPEPLDEARNAAYYLDELMLHTVARRARGARRRARLARRRPAAGPPGRCVRQLDRRRPRRQPERHAAGHPRRARAAARPRDPRPRGDGRRPAARTCPRRSGWSERATSCWPASSATSQRCPSSTPACGASTPTSRTDSRAAASAQAGQHPRPDRGRRRAPARPRLPGHRRAARRTCR